MYFIENFKGFAETGIDLFKPVTVLIGPNGSGKSNLIEAVELLGFLARGGKLYEVTDINREGKQEVRGGLQACPHRDGKSFTLGFSAMLGEQGFEYRLTISTEPPRITDESLYLGDTMYFEVIPGNADKNVLHVRYNNFAQGGNKPKDTVSSAQSLLSQYKNFAKSRNIKKGLSVINGIAEYLKASFVFDPIPRLMRDYERIDNQVLARNGANISAVLYSLSQGDEKEQQSLERILQWIKQVPDEPYEGFEFITTQLNDVIFAFKESDTQRLISAGVMSDGTLRCLAVLTALETASPGARIIIEEFDNGLHPGRVGVLVQAIEECSKRRELNVLVTTHNPATLDALQPEQLNGVVNCVYDAEKHATKLIPLTELPRYVELMERGQLGDLVTRRILEKYLVSDFEETRKEKILAWLEKV